MNVPQRRMVELDYGHKCVRGIVEGSDGDPHTCMVRFDGRRICDCQGFHYNDLCRHLVALARSVPAESTRELLLSIVEREGDAEPGRFSRGELQ